MIWRGAAFALLIPGHALACACCADPGERFEYQVSFGEYERGELASLQADGPAFVFQTACGTDCIQGIDALQDEYDVSINVEESDLVFGIEGHGELTFEMPDTFTYYGVDLSPTEDAQPTVLYTEMRFRSRVITSGDFSSGRSAELVISGEGNICISAQAMEHWRLSVSGDGVNYRLFGELSPR